MVHCKRSGYGWCMFTSDESVNVIVHHFSCNGCKPYQHISKGQYNIINDNYSKIIITSWRMVFLKQLWPCSFLFPESLGLQSCWFFLQLWFLLARRFPVMAWSRTNLGKLALSTTIRECNPKVVNSISTIHKSSI